MFGAIVAGRPVLTNLRTLSDTQFAFAIPAQPAFSHLVVFLLPGHQLPPGAAAAVYVQLPPAADFRLLGAVANEKPSAVFKVHNPGGGAGGVLPAADDIMVDEAAPTEASITLGISLEPVQQVASALEAQKAAAAPVGTELVRHQPAGGGSPVPTKVLAQRIIGNAFNFLASFAGNGPGGDEMVPLKSFRDWWAKFEKKIELDPGFLERGDQP